MNTKACRNCEQQTHTDLLSCLGLCHECASVHLRITLRQQVSAEISKLVDQLAIVDATWQEAQGFGVDANAVEGYPFRDSLDDVVMRAIYWKEGAQRWASRDESPQLRKASPATSQIVDTSGGSFARAWTIGHLDGFILLTDDDANVPDENTTDFCVGLYQGSLEELGSDTCLDQESFDTLDDALVQVHKWLTLHALPLADCPETGAPNA